MTDTLTHVICSGDSAIVDVVSDLVASGGNYYQLNVLKEGTVTGHGLSDGQTLLMATERDTVLNKALTNSSSAFDTLELQLINFIDNDNGGTLDNTDCIGDTVIVEIIVEPVPTVTVTLSHIAEFGGSNADAVNIDASSSSTLTQTICSGDSIILTSIADNMSNGGSYDSIRVIKNTTTLEVVDDDVYANDDLLEIIADSASNYGAVEDTLILQILNFVNADEAMPVVYDETDCLGDTVLVQIYVKPEPVLVATIDTVCSDSLSGIELVVNHAFNSFQDPDLSIKQIIDNSGDGSGNSLESARGIRLDNSDNIFVMGGESDNVFKITPGGAVTEIIDASGDMSGHNLNGPRGIAVDVMGNVYVSGYLSDNVFKITPGGSITEIIDASGDGSNSLDNPRGLAVDGLGNVYVAGLQSNNVFKIAPGGGKTEIIDASGDGSSGFSGPIGLAIDMNNNVYVAGSSSNNVFKIDQGGNITEILDSSGDGNGNVLSGPRGIFTDLNGNVFVGGLNSNNVFKIDQGGNITEILDSSGDGNGNVLSGPQGITVDATNNVFVSGQNSGNVFRITPEGNISKVIDMSGDGLGNQLLQPFSVAVNSSGNLFVGGLISDNLFEVIITDLPVALFNITAIDNKGLPVTGGVTDSLVIPVSGAITGAPFDTLSAEQWTNARDTDVVVTYTVVPVLDGCPGDTVDIQLIVEPVPTMSIDGADTTEAFMTFVDTVCHGEVLNLKITSPTVPSLGESDVHYILDSIKITNTTDVMRKNGSLIGTVATTDGEFTNGGAITDTLDNVSAIAAVILNDSLTNTGTEPDSVIYYFTPILASKDPYCPGEQVTLTIVVEPQPTIGLDIDVNSMAVTVPAEADTVSVAEGNADFEDTYITVCHGDTLDIHTFNFETVASGDQRYEVTVSNNDAISTLDGVITNTRRTPADSLYGDFLAKSVVQNLSNVADTLTLQFVPYIDKDNNSDIGPGYCLGDTVWVHFVVQPKPELALTGISAGAADHDLTGEEQMGTTADTSYVICSEELVDFTVTEMFTASAGSNERFQMKLSIPDSLIVSFGGKMVTYKDTMFDNLEFVGGEFDTSIVIQHVGNTFDTVTMSLTPYLENDDTTNPDNTEMSDADCIGDEPDVVIHFIVQPVPALDTTAYDPEIAGFDDSGSGEDRNGTLDWDSNKLELSDIRICGHMGDGGMAFPEVTLSTRTTPFGGSKDSIEFELIDVDTLTPSGVAYAYITREDGISTGEEISHDSTFSETLHNSGDSVAYVTYSFRAQIKDDADADEDSKKDECFGDTIRVVVEVQPEPEFDPSAISDEIYKVDGDTITIKDPICGGVANPVKLVAPDSGVVLSALEVPTLDKQVKYEITKVIINEDGSLTNNPTIADGVKRAQDSLGTMNSIYNTTYEFASGDTLLEYYRNETNVDVFVTYELVPYLDSVGDYTYNNSFDNDEECHGDTFYVQIQIEPIPEFDFASNDDLPEFTWDADARTLTADVICGGMTFDDVNSTIDTIVLGAANDSLDTDFTGDMAVSDGRQIEFELIAIDTLVSDGSGGMTAIPAAYRMHVTRGDDSGANPYVVDREFNQDYIFREYYRNETDTVVYFSYQLVPEIENMGSSIDAVHCQGDTFTIIIPVEPIPEFDTMGIDAFYAVGAWSAADDRTIHPAMDSLLCGSADNTQLSAMSGDQIVWDQDTTEYVKGREIIMNSRSVSGVAGITPDDDADVQFVILSVDTTTAPDGTGSRLAGVLRDNDNNDTNTNEAFDVDTTFNIGDKFVEYYRNESDSVAYVTYTLQPEIDRNGTDTCAYEPFQIATGLQPIPDVASIDGSTVNIVDENGDDVLDRSTWDQTTRHLEFDDECGSQDGLNPMEFTMNIVPYEVPSAGLQIEYELIDVEVTPSFLTDFILRYDTGSVDNFDLTQGFNNSPDEFVPVGTEFAEVSDTATFTEFIANLSSFPATVTYSFRPQIDSISTTFDGDIYYGDVFTVEVKVNPIPTASANADDEDKCEGDLFVLTGSPNNTIYNPAPFTHVWSIDTSVRSDMAYLNGALLDDTNLYSFGSANEQTTTLAVYTAGIVRVMYQAQDANGCWTVPYFLDLEIAPDFVITKVPAIAVCESMYGSGSSVEVDLNLYEHSDSFTIVSDGPGVMFNYPADSIVWYNGQPSEGGTPLSETAEGQVTLGNNGIFNGDLWVRIIDDGGCESEANVPFEIYDMPDVSISADALVACQSGSDITLDTMPSMGTLTFPSGLSVDAGTIDVAASTPGSYYVSYEFTNANGCTNADSIQIEILSNPVAIIDTSWTGDTICPAELITLTGSGGDLYEWSEGTTYLGTNPVLSVDTFSVGEHTITLTVTDVNGCMASDSVTFVVADEIEPVIDIADESIYDKTFECGPTTHTEVAAYIAAITDTIRAKTTDNCVDAADLTIANDYSAIPSQCSSSMGQEIKYTIQDGNGNEDSIKIRIKVLDTTAPVLTVGPDVTLNESVTGVCPDEATISAINNDTITVASMKYAIPTATDNCDNDVDVTMTSVKSGNGCRDTIAVTWTADDACNTINHTQLFIIIDDVAPVVADEEPYELTSSDHEFCPVDTVGLSDVDVVNEIFEFGDGPEVLTVLEGINIDLSEFVEDGYLFGDSVIAFPMIDGFSMDCQDEEDFIFTLVSIDIEELTPCVQEFTVTWAIDDGCGNIAYPEQTLIIENDDEIVVEGDGVEGDVIEVTGCANQELDSLLSIEVGDDFTLGAGSTFTIYGDVDTLIEVFNIDLTEPLTCAFPVTATVTEIALGSPDTGDPCTRDITILWSVTNGCAVEIVEQQITMTDTTAPVVTVPDTFMFSASTFDPSICALTDINVIVPTPEDVPSGVNMNFGGQIVVGPEVADDCQTWTMSYEGAPSTSTACETIWTIEWSVNDGCEDYTHNQYIKVVDDIAPVVTAPDPIVVEGCDSTDVMVGGFTFLPFDTDSTITYSQYIDESGSPSAEDNCVAGANLTITYSDQVDSAPGANPTIITRTYTISDGCDNETKVTQEIRVLNSLVVTADDNGDNTLCVGESRQLIGTATANGDQTFTYDWQIIGAANASIVDTTSPYPTLTGDVAGDVLVRLYAESSLGCVDSADLSFVIHSIPSLVADTLTVCETLAGAGLGSFDLTSAIVSAAAGETTTYHLSEADAHDGTGATGDMINAIDGTIIYARVETDKGCYDIAEIVLEVDPLPVLSVATKDVVCPGDATGTAMVSATGGTADFSYGIVAVDTNATGSFSALPAGDYTVEVTNQEGCMSTIDFTIEQVDTEAPSITCDRPVTIYVDGSCEATMVSVVDSITASDNCMIVDTTQSIAVGESLAIGTSSVEITVTDDSGNASSCELIVTVLDTTSPEAMCVGALTVQLDETGTTSISVDDIDDGSSDNCAISTMTINQTIFDCDDIGNTNMVTLTVTDIYGNTDECMTTVTVEDKLAPTAICKDTTIYVGMGAISLTGMMLDGGSTDACGIDTIVSKQDMFDCSDLGVNSILVTVTDNNGNESTCTALVTVLDTVAPTFATIADIVLDATANCEGLMPAIADTINSGMDNCVAVTFTQSISAGEPLALGATDVVITATDGSGNETAQTVTITVVDYAAPIAVCVPDSSVTVSLDALGNGTLTVSQIDAGSSDNCGIDSIWIDKTSFACGEVGAQEVTLHVRDAAGNSNSCTTEVLVVDAIAPTAICKDTTIYVGTGAISLTGMMLDGGSTDACGIDTIVSEQDMFSCDDLGVNSILVTVTDENGNTSTCSALVTVLDTIAPTFATIGDITLDATANCSGIMPAIADTISSGSDLCGVLTFTQSISAGEPLALGATDVVITATDGSGNETAQTVTITVEDNTAPIAVCVPDNSVTVSLDASGAGLLTVAQIDGGSSDNCGIDSIWIDKTSFGCGDVGPQTVTLSVRDDAMQVTTCMTMINVVDAIAPTAICKDTTIYVGMGAISLTGLMLDGGSSDACGIDTVIAEQDMFDCDDLGVNSILVTVTDENGNASTCTALVTVLDTVAPTFATIAAITLDATANCEGIMPAVADTISSGSDLCGEVTFTQSISAGEPLALGATEVVITATDGSGNETAQTLMITVLDNTDPIAVCVPDSSVTVSLDAFGNGTLTVSQIDGGSSDNCGIDSIWIDKTSFACGEVGAQAVTLHVRDAAGNSNSCTTEVLVVDAIAPTAICKDTTIYVGSGSISLTGMMLDGGSSDACGIDTVIAEQDMFDCSDLGVNSILVTVTDNNGNASPCTALVTVLDTVAPTFATIGDITLDATANCEGIMPAIADTITSGTDNCVAVTFTQSISAGEPLALGATDVVITATDGSGNEIAQTLTITVEDNTDPIAVCVPDSSVTVSLDASGMGTLTVAQIDAGSSDNCGIDSIWIDKTSFGCGDVGAQDVKLIVEDNAGNKDSCITKVLVVDAIAPTAICKDTTIYVGMADVTVTGLMLDGGSSDACGIDTVIAEQTIFSCADIGVNSILVTVTDENGNASTRTALVTVLDTVAPTFATIGDITLDATANCEGIMPAIADTISSGMDNCGVVTFTQSISSGEPLALGATDVVITATDGSGNETAQTLTITVSDGVAPSIVCPSDMMVVDMEDDCSALVPDMTGLAIVEDNCQVDTVYQSIEAGSVLSTTHDSVFVITLYVEDTAGNIDSCSATFRTVDVTQPVITGCEQDIIVPLSASCMLEIPDLTDSVDVDVDCSDVSIVQSPAPGMVESFDGDEIPVRLFVTDAAGNSTFCTIIVSAEDMTAPTFDSAPGDVTVHLTVTDGCEVIVPNLGASASDNCTNNVTVSASIPVTQPFGLGATTVTYTATDAAGNSTDHEFTVTVVDTISPVIECPAMPIVVALDENCSILIPDLIAQVEMSDNCTIDSVSQSLPIATTVASAHGMQHTVTITVKDQSGNTSTCDVILEAVDQIAPVIADCPDDIELPIDENCKVTIPDFSDMVSASDNCAGALTISQDIIGLADLAHGSTQTVTITVADAAGLATTCTVVVTAVDQTAPVIECRADTTIYATVDQDCGALYMYGMPTATDNCAGTTVSLTEGIASSNLFPVGETSLSFEAVDAAGNVASCTYTVTVLDTIRPTVLCPGDQVADVVGNCEAAIPDLLALTDFADNCDIMDTYQVPAAGSLIASASSVVVYAMDASGNIDSCTVQITMPDVMIVEVDITDEIDCFGDADGDAMVTASGGVAPYSYLWSNGATGTTVNNLGAGGYSVTVTDANGCEVTVPFNMTQPELFTVSIDSIQDANCGLDNGYVRLDPDGGTADYSYAWSDGGAGRERSDLAAGIYLVTALDANGCTVEINVEIDSEVDTSMLNIIGPEVVCQNSIPTYSIESPVNDPNTTYIWTYSGTNTQVEDNENGSVQLIFGQTATIGSLTVEMTNSCGTFVREIAISFADPIVCNSACPETLFVDNANYLSNDPHQSTFTADRTITSDGIITSANNENIEFFAGESIELQPGFEVQLGAEFSADIEPCSDRFSFNRKEYDLLLKALKEAKKE